MRWNRLASWCMGMLLAIGMVADSIAHHVSGEHAELPQKEANKVVEKQAEPPPQTAGPTEKSAEAAKKPGAKILYWTDPMVPGYRADHPGKSPFMDMDLVPVYASDPSIVTVSESGKNIIGIETAVAEPRPFTRLLRTEGDITYDERNAYEVTIRINAQVTKYHPFNVGEMVTKGQPLVELQSPELYSLSSTFLATTKNMDTINAISFTGSHLVNQGEVALRWRGISQEDIDHMVETGKPMNTLTVKAPITGLVLARRVNYMGLVNAGVKTGQFTTYGQSIATIANISFLYAEAAIYGSDMDLIQPGIEARVRVPAIPDKVFIAKITYVYPVVRNAERVRIARIAIANPDFVLKPGMYAEIDLLVPYGSDKKPPLVVPREAVIGDDDSQHHVFVQIDPEHYHLQPVKVGPATGSWVAVEDGLVPGDQVVVHGNFFLDADIRMRSEADGS